MLLIAEYVVPVSSGHIQHGAVFIKDVLLPTSAMQK